MAGPCRKLCPGVGCRGSPNTSQSPDEPAAARRASECSSHRLRATTGETEPEKEVASSSSSLSDGEALCCVRYEQDQGVGPHALEMRLTLGAVGRLFAGFTNQFNFLRQLASEKNPLIRAGLCGCPGRVWRAVVLTKVACASHIA